MIIEAFIVANVFVQIMCEGNRIIDDTRSGEYQDNRKEDAQHADVAVAWMVVSSHRLRMPEIPT
jgi:hypothetical protein